MEKRSDFVSKESGGALPLEDGLEHGNLDA